MLLYLSIFLFSVLFAFFADYTQGKARITFLICTVFILSIFGGLRDIGVGTDTVTYSWSYFNVAKHLSSWSEFLKLRQDKAYVLLNYLATKLSNNIWIAHFLTQLLTNGLIFIAAFLTKKIYGLKLWLFTLIYCFIFYNQTFNFMRQYCAMALLLVGFYYILNERWKNYAICQVIAFFFHSSSLVFVLIPFIYYICTKGYKNRILLYLMICVLALFVFLLPIYYYDILRYVHSMDIVSDVYATRYGEGDKYGAREGVRKSLVLILLYVLYLIYIAYKRTIMDRRYTVFLLSLSLLFIAFYTLSFRSIYLYRLALYFYLPIMLFTGIIVSSKKVSHPERIGFLLLLFLDWYVYVVLHNGSGAFPYRSLILGI
ncbi:MAG: EpsG family protein [Prevotella sp.]|nr:EpsG family protein [Prevotella sp.]